MRSGRRATLEARSRGCSGRKLLGSIQAASGLEEQANRVKVMFGGAAGGIEAFAETADQALGLTERAAL